MLSLIAEALNWMMNVADFRGHGPLCNSVH